MLARELREEEAARVKEEKEKEKKEQEEQEERKRTVAMRLPTEVLVMVFEQLTQREQASVAARVCRRWNEVVVPMVYREVVFGEAVEEVLEAARVAREETRRWNRLIPPPLPPTRMTATTGKEEEMKPEDVPL